MFPNILFASISWQKKALWNLEVFEAEENFVTFIQYASHLLKKHMTPLFSLSLLNGWRFKARGGLVKFEEYWNGDSGENNRYTNENAGYRIANSANGVELH